MPIINLVYGGETAQPITTAGIYHNSDLGLISLSSDGSNWLTIADKNLGATSTDVSSSASYGNYYQRGNNYGFTSSPTNKANSQTNAGVYGPGNYYSSNIFRYKGNASWYNWDSSDNYNLWGDVTNTLEARKGPCNTGFHIPSSTEWQNLYNSFKAIGTDEWRWQGDYMKQYLLMPYAGGIAGNTGTYSNYGGHYRSSTTGTQNYNDNGISISSGVIVFNSSGLIKIYGASIRPFKNDAVQPNSSWTKLY